MEKTKVTEKEFKQLLKEIDFVDVKNEGYGYILIVIASDLLSDAVTLKRLGCTTSSQEIEKQVEGIKDFLKTHGYFNEERK